MSHLTAIDIPINPDDATIRRVSAMDPPCSKCMAQRCYRQYV
jgi:hypothetical protein